MDVDLALKISRLIHDTCDNAPHDIGFSVMEIIINDSNLNKDA